MANQMLNLTYAGDLGGRPCYEVTSKDAPSAEKISPDNSILMDLMARAAHLATDIKAELETRDPK